MKKLISMTDYVLAEKLMLNIKGYEKDFISKTFNYANFLKQPLALGMFITTDENGVPYESYLTYDGNNNTICEPYEGLFEIDANSKCSGWKYLDSERTRYYDSVSYEIANNQFQQAKDRVIFEGFELINDELINNGVLFWVGKFDGYETIENCIPSNLTITETAVKKYGL